MTTPTHVAVIVAAALLVAFASPALALDAGDKVLLTLTDGTEAAGVVRADTDEGLLVRTECGEFVFAPSEIEEVRLNPDFSIRPYSLSGDRSFDPGSSEASQFRRQYLTAPGYRDYQELRLQLTDRRLRWMGPASLGYRSKLLGRSNRGAFHVVRAGLPFRALVIRDFVAIAGDHNLTTSVSAMRRESVRKIQVAILLLGAGTLSIIGGGALNYLGSPNGIGTGGQPYGVPLFLVAIPAFIIAGGLGISATKRVVELEEADISEAITRTDAWRIVQRHNGRLRVELGLPDDERLDAP